MRPWQPLHRFPMYRLVLLDRDGVINHRPSPKRDGHPGNYIKTPREWSPIPGALEAVATLNALGCLVAVCTNQSGVGRGIMSTDALAAVHRHMEAALREAGGRLDGVYVCPHRPDEACACRKPRPGLLREAMADFRVRAAETCFVGDSLRDIEAARAARCEAILVRTGGGAAVEAEARIAGVRFVYDDLAAAVDRLSATATTAGTTATSQGATSQGAGVDFRGRPAGSAG